MKKQAVTPALAILCVILIFMVFSKTGRNSITQDLSASKAITTSQVNGISLSTDINTVDALAKKQGFNCTRTDNTQSSPDKKNQSIRWACTHTSLERTFLNMTAQNGEIKNIIRSGALNVKDVNETLNYIDSVKVRINTRDFTYFTQTPNRATLTIQNNTENIRESLRLDLMTRNKTNADGQQQSFAVYSANISRN